MNVISTAAAEYYQRPDDERYTSYKALIDAAILDKAHSVERKYNLRDLRAVAVPGLPINLGDPTPRSSVQLESPKGIATFTHHSFGQLCRSIGGEFSRGTSLLRSLPAEIAAQAINHGLQDAAPVGTRANLLIKANGGQPIVRAATSETYGRLWDADLHQEAYRYFGDDRTSNGGQWMTPPAWPGSKPSGNYKGDRDSFVLRVDGGSIVTDPSASNGNGQMYRGLLIRNSEVGQCSVTIECILFRYVCGNHNLWGAVMDRKYARRHVGKHIVQDVMRELASMARSFNQRTASEDERIIKGLITHEIAHTRAAVIDELKKIGYTQRDAAAAYDACERTETAPPTSYWGIAQGTTRISQDSGHQDDRLTLDTLASLVLKRGAQLVTV